MTPLYPAYPHLLATTQPPWAPVTMRFIPMDAMLPAALISNVNLVPCVGDQWVIVHVDGEGWEVPGGTIEDGESPMDALHRELKEEAGAVLVETPRVIGAWHHVSHEAAPYRPHPHPEFYRVVWVGEVDLVAPPTNPAGALAVSRVDVVSLEEAVARFKVRGRLDLAELYEFARAQVTPDLSEVASGGVVEIEEIAGGGAKVHDGTG